MSRQNRGVLIVFGFALLLLSFLNLATDGHPEKYGFRRMPSGITPGYIYLAVGIGFILYNTFQLIRKK
jgi:hypothetical protein